MMDTRSQQKTRREHRKTGLFTLRHALIDLGSRAIDERSTVGVALRKWKEDLINDPNGNQAISTQQETLIEFVG